MTAPPGTAPDPSFPVTQAAGPDFDPPFSVAEPPGLTSAFTFNAPHAGDVYPASFLASSRLDPAALRRSEDAFVDRLFSGVVQLGAPLMSARFPRAYLDVNREPFELDPRMFDGRLPAHANTRSMRVAGGLGTIPRIVADGQEIYAGRLPVAEALDRIERLYKPYHRTLRYLLGRSIDRFGTAILIDCHSMPSSSLGRDQGTRADMVLGDRHGTSCSGMLTDGVEKALQARGYQVVRNKPYAGGFITEHYGVPALGRHVLQVEVNRAIYMDERTILPRSGFAALAADLALTFAAAMRDFGAGFEPNRVAAE